MSVRAAQPRAAQLVPAQGAGPGPAPPSPAKHLPLSVVLKTGFDTGLLKQGEDLDAEEGALCTGQVRFVAKRGLSYNRKDFEFRIKRSKRPFGWESVVAFFDGSLGEPYFAITPDSLDKVVTLLKTIHAGNPRQDLLINGGWTDEDDPWDDMRAQVDVARPLGRSLIQNDKINRNVLARFLAEEGIRKNHQSCIIYLTPYDTYWESEEAWLANGDEKKPRRM